MVERIDLVEVATHRASPHEEVHQFAESFRIQTLQRDEDVGHAANLFVSCESAVVGLLIDVVEAFAFEVVQTIEVVFVMRNDDVHRGGLDVQNGFEEDGGAFLDELAQRVEVGREGRRVGKKAGVVLALGFAKELLPPFTELDEARFISDEHFNGITGFIKDVAEDAILIGRVVLFLAIEF